VIICFLLVEIRNQDFALSLLLKWFVWSLEFEVANLFKSSFKFGDYCKDFGLVSIVCNFVLLECVNKNNPFFSPLPWMICIVRY